MDEAQLTHEVIFGDERVPRRIWDKLTVTDTGCWHWLGAMVGPGNKAHQYGGVWFERRMWRLHRLFFEIFVRAPSADEHVHHECRNKLCANPAHLHALRGKDHCGHQHRDKTHCKHGHAFDEANTYIKSNGCRSCKACLRRRSRESKQRRAEG